MTFHQNASNAGNIVFNVGSSVSGTSGSLVLSAGTASGVITVPTASISVANFNLLQGSFIQITGSGFTPMAAFSVTNNFQIASGALNPTNVAFLRAAGGSGTSGSPYQIFDIYGLQGINSNATAAGNLKTLSYIVNNDIDASATANWNSANTDKGFIPIGFGSNSATVAGTEFSGNFNGNGFAINNLVQSSALTGGNCTTSSCNSGLFGAVAGTAGGVTIQNTALLNASINGNNDIGGLIGNLIGNGSTTVTVSKNYVTGRVTSNSGSGYAATGGLVGVTLSSGTVNITDNASLASVVGPSNTGGLIGYIQGGTVTISRNFSAGLVSNGATNKGLIGSNGGSTTTTNNYWDTQTSGQTTSQLGVTARV